MSLRGFLSLAAVVTLVSCVRASTDDSTGPVSTATTGNAVTSDESHASQVNRMAAARTIRADAETTMLRHRLQDDARDYVVARKLPAGSGWTQENLMFKRITDEAGFRAIVEGFYGYPDRYAPIFAKLKRYSSATFVGLTDDAYCVLYFDAAGVLIDGSVF